ncbi:MAG: UDP-2,3-diacylglucosamine diphosphatase [Nevskia sp.]|nr:UDP-2,3-diacylglucosamine diphosphatase [Nevskia sp.]
MSALLLSDLHLPIGPSPLREGFARFLQGPARQAETVYILGDLFEYWIGDDAGLRDYDAEVAALQRLAQTGVRVRYMHGNRDFLAGARFAAAAGLELLPDPLQVDLAGEPTLLSHGDLYCTDDRAYLRWRRFSRNPLVQRLFGLLPEGARRRVAGTARSRSEVDKSHKPESIMDVNADAVRNAFARYGVTRIIHGHTHRPAEHDYHIGGRACRRIVLADWRPLHMEYLVCEAQGWRRQTV